tara:strand:+ start:213 stop:563 length:351 start_codon:yes stop_codon:yes gene_type:complete
MTTLYHNPRCSKSRDALALLKERGIQFDVVNYLEETPSEKELGAIIELLGISPDQLVRKKEKLFKELGLGDRKMTDKQWISTLVANPTLIERPIVVHDGKAAIGRPTENIAAILGD